MRSPSVRAAALALVGSRLLIWAVGVPARLHYGVGRDVVFDYNLVSQSLGRVGNILAAPAIRWDAAWYINTAHFGYPTDSAFFGFPSDAGTTYFPFYSLLIRGLNYAVSPFVGSVRGSYVISALLISFTAFFVALVILHRLTALELGRDVATRTVVLLAFFPIALFFSAAYTESLFLALELGAFWAARRGRWWLAGVLGMCGSATRNTGVLMLAVLAFMYVYGPRADAPPGPPRGRLRLRYPVKPDVAWLALVPLGLVAYLVYLGIRFDDPFVTFSAQSHFHRSFDGPLSAVWQGAHQALDSLGDLLAGRARGEALRALAVFGVVAAGLVAAAGVLRRLPAAYGVYTVLGLLPALSFPQEGHPLASASRYLLVLFPLFMWLGMRLTDRRAYVATLVVFAGGLAYAAATFATWRFVA